MRIYARHRTDALCIFRHAPEHGPIPMGASALLARRFRKIAPTDQRPV